MIKKVTCLFVVLLCNVFALSAQTLKVAVAANLQSVIKVLAADFNKKSGIVIEPIIGSSGNLTTQIKNGAPFYVFLSADMSFPQSLFKDGFTLAEPKVYASGSLIICSDENIDFKHWETTLLNPSVFKIAIANPAVAPYGKAAQEALTKLDLYDKITDKIVTGESIAQINTFITTGAVSLGFTSLSFTKEPNVGKLYWKAIDKSLYSPIEQGMVIIKQTPADQMAAAKAFYDYMLSGRAKAILKSFGYQTN